MQSKELKFVNTPFREKRTKLKISMLKFLYKICTCYVTTNCKEYYYVTQSTFFTFYSFVNAASKIVNAENVVFSKGPYFSRKAISLKDIVSTASFLPLRKE